MSEKLPSGFNTIKNRAKEYQQKNKLEIHTGITNLADRVKRKLDNSTFAIESDFETTGDFNSFVESMEQAEIISNVCTPITENIFFIKAGTGSGKTHAVLEAIRDGVISTADGKAVAATPTRAMAMDIQNTGNMRVANGEDFVGLWIGGKDGKDIDQGDKAVAVTGGKLWDLLMKDPTLGGFTNPLTKGDNQPQHRQSNRGLEQVSTLIIDEADAMDARAIPAIKWLSQVRPDMKIIFVSATLNIQEFNNIYRPNPESAFIAPEQDRPRSIKVDYIPPNLSQNLKLSNRPTAKSYTQAPMYVLDTWILGPESDEVRRSKSIGIEVPNEHPLLETGESVIVFMPTISSVERLSEQLKFRYGKKAEIRALHGRLSPEEIDRRLYDNLEPDKIGIFICTDVVGRGVNFPDQFNINRTIDVGLRNRPQYDPVTGREVLKVDKGTQADVLQGLGRAGRNTDDDRPVIGFVMQPEEVLFKGITNHMVSNDPTQLILESAGILKKIQGMGEIPDQYKPHSLIDYLKTLDSNPATSRQFEAKLQSSLNRLYGIQAIDGQNNLTEFGQFLVKMKYPVDYGIMLFESLESPHLSKIIRMINLVDNLDYLETRYEGSKEDYTILTKLFKDVYGENIKSDLQFYAKLMDMAEPYIEDYIFKSGEISSKPINRQQQESTVNKHIDEKDIDALLKYVFQNNCGHLIGIELDTLASAHQGIERVYKNLDSEKIDYSKNLVATETFDEALQRLALYAFPSTIMKYVSQNKYGEYEYTHLPTNSTIVISKASINLIEGDQNNTYLTCASVRMDSRISSKFYASGVQPVTLKGLTDVDKYTSWIVKKDPTFSNLIKFDPEMGVGEGQQDYVFQDYVHNTTRVIDKATVVINQQSQPEIIQMAMQEYIIANIAELDPNYKESAETAKRYTQLSELASINQRPLSIPSKQQEMINLHYTNKIKALGTIRNLQDFRDALAQSNVSLKLEIEDYLQDADYDILDLMESKYPDSIDGFTINYTVMTGRIVPYISVDKETVYSIVKSGTLEKKMNELGIEIKFTYINSQNLGTVGQVAQNIVDKDIVEMKKAFLNDLNVPSYYAINSQSDLQKLVPHQVGVHPITDEPIMYYPYISTDARDTCTIFWSTNPTEIKNDKNYKSLVDRVNIVSNFEAVKSQIQVQLGPIQHKLTQSNDQDNYSYILGLYSKIANLQETEITSTVIDTVSRLNKEIAEINNIRYYGEAATNLVNAQIEILTEKYPEGREYIEDEVLEDRTHGNISSLKIDGKVVLKVSLSLNRATRKFEAVHTYTDEYVNFQLHPKCSEADIITQDFINEGYWERRQQLENEQRVRVANERVENSEWMYGRLVIDSEKKNKLYKRVIGILGSIVGESEKKEIERFITHSKQPVFADDKVEVGVEVATNKYKKQFTIVQISSLDTENIDPKNDYYFNIKDDQGGKNNIIAKNLTPNGDVHVWLISGDVNIQPPFPFPSNLPTEQSIQEKPEPAVSTEDLQALLGAFGGKKDDKKKKKK